MKRVITPYGQATVVELLNDKVYVELDHPHQFGNREYTLWLFDESEIKYI